MNLSFLHSHLPKRNLIVAAGILLLLSIISSLYFRINPGVGNEVKKLEQYIHFQERDFNQLLHDTVLLKKLVQQSETLEEFQQIAKKQYGIFLYAETLYNHEDLLFWNHQNVLPTITDFHHKEGDYFKRFDNGYYVVVKSTLLLPGMSNHVTAFCLIPVLYDYGIETDILVKHFAHDEAAIKKIFISAEETPFVVHAFDNRRPLFYIGQKAHVPVLSTDPITLLLRITALLLLLTYVQFVAESLTVNKGAVKSVLFLTGVLIGIRVILYLFPGIFYFRQFQLFNPTVYGTNSFNKSLGDLLINAIMFCWIAVFAWYNIGPIKRLPVFLQGKKVYVAGIIALFGLILSTFQLANIVRSLVADSSISFNVTDFFTLNIFTFIGFIVLALLSLTYYYFTRILFRFIFPAFEKRNILIYFIIAFTGLVFLTFRSGNTIVLFHIPVLAWLLVYTLLLSQEQFIINHFKVTMASVLFWIFIFSVSLSAIILQENKKKEWIHRKSLAEKQHELTDPSQAKVLSIALAYLDNDFLSRNFDRFSNRNSNRYLRDSIINEKLFVGYRNAYTTKIYVFDSSDIGLYNDEPLSYAELNNIFTIRSKPTGIPDLYYHETSFDNFAYITKRTVQKDSTFLGTFFIISTPKKNNTEAFYPEIFRQIHQVDLQNSPLYSYAIYNDRLLISYSSKYPFQTTLTDKQVPVSEYERRENGDYDELWYKAPNKKIVVIAKKQDSLIESITLFSYLFCSFLFMVALLQVIAFTLNSAYNLSLSHLYSQFSIRSQVHGTIIFISILSFVIIGAATISFFIIRYNRNNMDKLSRTSGIMVKEMEKRMEASSTFDDVIKIYDPVSNYNLKKLIEEVADIHNVDVNVYDLQGNLQVSSRADVYQLGILSTKMHPEAFYHLNRLRQVQYVQEEKMASLGYLSIYTPVRDEKGRVYAYLNIPYFLSQIDLNQEISNFLVTIINLNAFIFLIAGVIALFITNKITRSFSIIGNKMKEITLGRTNEEIVWNHKDEIGDLVLQYNKMVRQLEQSAEALAKSEREGAWREMARQVAHEIKNPLTPMKLSIQYLQRAINNNHPNVKELTSNVANTLVEQIDHLSKIAADFSRFANIGERHLELFDLHQVLGSLIDLYNSNARIKLIWNKPEQEILIRADRTHINRLFTNLLTNAVDACVQQEICIIEINEEINEETVLISVKDNGEGIAEEMHSKIFTPNFTTKTSGTGLGLAMCKRIVEQAEGDIWFETEVGQGTTFFVQLPVNSE